MGCTVHSCRFWFAQNFVTGIVTGLGLWFAIPGLAQDAQLSGFVEDSSGAKVEHARIKVTNEDTAIDRETESNSSGAYTVPGLSPGRYRTEVDAQGFQKLERTGITLEVAQQGRVDFQLQVASTNETVTVSANASTIDTADASVRTVISRDMVDNLPLNGRTFQQLITLAPGVNLTGSAGSGGTTPLGEFTVN
jgi:Carboxypeptidase regulatory-like domain